MDYGKEYDLLRTMEQVYSSIITVSNKLQATGNKYCSPLTSRQYMTILAILHLPENETTIVNIANKLGATKQNITQVIESLKKKEFVSIIPSVQDKRAINVIVTELGIEAMVNCGKNSIVDFMAEIFKDFKKEELEVFWRMLIKLYSFDGVKMDGFETDVQIPNTVSNEDIRRTIERFSSRRKEAANETRT
jgi:DNA-binding MarR family transcriptional regulator